MVNNAPADGYVMSYLGLRKAVGLIGILLPLVLWLGTIMLGGPALLGSISGYYHSDMGNVFVGSMCAFGVFLWSYRYGRADNIAGSIAGTLAIGVALFPTKPAAAPNALLSVGTLHLVCAGLFFLTLAYFAFVLFRKNDGSRTPRKRMRDMVYATCGWLIVISMVGAIAGPLVLGETYHELRLLFVFEAVAIEAFGIAWFVKGGAILKDVSTPDHAVRSSAPGGSPAA